MKARRRISCSGLEQVLSDSKGAGLCLLRAWPASAVFSCRQVSRSLRTSIDRILAKRFFSKRIVEALARVIGPDAGTFCRLINESSAKLAGSFLLGAIEATPFNDIDIFQPDDGFSNLENWLWTKVEKKQDLVTYSRYWTKPNAQVRTYAVEGWPRIQVVSCSSPRQTIAHADLDFLKNAFDGLALRIQKLQALATRSSEYTVTSHLGLGQAPMKDCSARTVSLRIHAVYCHVGRIFKYAARGFAIAGFRVEDRTCGELTTRIVFTHEGEFHRLVRHPDLETMMGAYPLSCLAVKSTELGRFLPLVLVEYCAHEASLLSRLKTICKQIILC